MPIDNARCAEDANSRIDAILENVDQDAIADGSVRKLYIESIVGAILDELKANASINGGDSPVGTLCPFTVSPHPIGNILNARVT